MYLHDAKTVDVCLTSLTLSVQITKYKHAKTRSSQC